MKRLTSAVLAVTLLGATAASADPYDHGGYNGNGYYDQRGDHYRGYRRHDDGAAVAVGIGALALVAILASQNHRHHHHRYHDRQYGRDGYSGDYGYDQDRDYRDRDNRRDW